MTAVLEALLLSAVSVQAAAYAQPGKATPPPSLELLEFLGEFGDDEEGLFDGETGSDAARAPAKDAGAGKPAPGTKPPPASPPASAPAPTVPPKTKVSS